MDRIRSIRQVHYTSHNSQRTVKIAAFAVAGVGHHALQRSCYFFPGVGLGAGVAAVAGVIAADSWWNTANHLPPLFAQTVDAQVGLVIGCPSNVPFPVQRYIWMTVLSLTQ